MRPNGKDTGLPKRDNPSRFIRQEKAQFFDRLRRPGLAFELKEGDQKVRVNIGDPS